MRNIFILLFLCTATLLHAQMRKKRGDVFPLDKEFKKSGLLIAPGIDYTFAGKPTENQFNVVDTNYSYTANPGGKIGYFAHIGWFCSFEKPRLVYYLDFGLSYKLFKGDESYDAIRSQTNPNLVSTFHSDNSFSDQNLGIFFNATHVIQFSQNKFISNSLGLNADYIFIKNRKRSTAYPIIDESFQPATTAQLHYKFGIGFRVTKKLIVVPSIETPLLSVYEFDKGRSTLKYFSSRYQPILFSLQFYFLRDGQAKCNTPNYNGPDYGM